MKEEGTRNPSKGAEVFGLEGLSELRWNWEQARLFEASVANGEADVTAHGALAAITGAHTGRSAKDKYIVRDEFTENDIWWDNNQAMTPEAFDLLKADMLEHAKGMKLYAQDLYGGAARQSRISVRVFCEYAWHALFIRYMLRRPEFQDLAKFVPELTIIDLPSFRADPKKYGVRSETVIAVNLKTREVLIGSTSYAGEMKKSVFGTLNYLLPPQGVMPMHCSANYGKDGDVALFFGLSGTGKTTLSADPNRTLLGDDEHGWNDEGVFNFEGGCYAKTIRLSREAEPEIFGTTEKFATVFENVVLDPATRVPDFDDGSLTENARCAYPIDYIPNADPKGLAGHPKNIIMLAADAFGVLPPIARLDEGQAMYHFLSGYTAKVAGTEKGVTEPEATFSTCFGAPFMPRHPSVYGNLLRAKIKQHGTSCWLVNTGWTGGAFGHGHRMPIKATRALLTAALDGSLNKAPMRVDPVFGFEVPTEVPGVDPRILDPRSTWKDPAAYDAQAQRLAEMFRANFAKFADHVDATVLNAAPAMKDAAE